MKFLLVVFDLDGTLISSHENIYLAAIHALREVGMNVNMPQDQFNKKIGLHFEDIFNDFGFKVPDFNHFLNIYKSVYFDYITSSFLYPGVNEMLKILREKNILVSLLTTKGQDQAELLINHFGLNNYFDYILGRRPGIGHKPSPEPLIKICNDLNVDINKTLIVGDSEMDIECGKNAGSMTCAVSYGYRDREELKNNLPDFLIDKILDLEYIVA